ncbi:hypothetical protein [Streptomyces sp. bgisy034]|uniref:hypothetical protein n=1 Tax=Streptomyces sp. bgisy034 TaxID=3413774 RepID=UPI003EBA2C64
MPTTEIGSLALFTAYGQQLCQLFRRVCFAFGQRAAEDALGLFESAPYSQHHAQVEQGIDVPGGVLPLLGLSHLLKPNSSLLVRTAPGKQDTQTELRLLVPLYGGLLKQFGGLVLVATVVTQAAQQPHGSGVPVGRSSAR